MSNMCPISRSFSCDPSCLWLRKAGCAVVLAATFAEEAKSNTEEMEHQLMDIRSGIRQIQAEIARIK